MQSFIREVVVTVAKLKAGLGQERILRASFVQRQKTLWQRRREDDP